MIGPVPQRLLKPLRLTCRRLGIAPTSHLLWASIPEQRMDWLARSRSGSPWDDYTLKKRFVVSTSRYGIGQEKNSYKTPLGLHRVAQKIGGGQPGGAVFSSRKHRGYIWAGMPGAAIAHRILWLDGLEPGFNRGGTVDTHSRYVYIHGVGDETGLGKPGSQGCIHLGAGDLIGLFDALPNASLVWITDCPLLKPRPGNWRA